MPTRYSGTDEERLALDVFIKLNRACLSVGRRIDGQLHEHDLTPIQFGVLDAITFAGALPMSALAEKNLCTQHSMGSVIDTMERKGLVRRNRSEVDRRVVLVDMTQRGREVHSDVWPEHLGRVVKAMTTMDRSELIRLDSLLRKLGTGG